MRDGEITELIEAYPQLDHEGVVELFEKYTDKDELAEVLYYHNLKLFVHLSKRKYWSVDFDEFMSLAYTAVTKSLSSYDPSKGQYPFYLGLILQRVVASGMRWHKKEISTISMELEVYSDGLKIIDTIPDDSVSDYTDMSENLLRVINNLPKQEKLVMNYFMEDLTFREIGSRMGVTHQRVHFIYKNCIVKLRRNMLVGKV